MASSKKSTNKTAHVMNLLSKNRTAAPADNTGPADEPGSADSSGMPAGGAPDTAHHPPVPPIMASFQPDAEASLQIRDALESALAEELGAEAGADASPPDETPRAATASEPAPDPQQESQPEEAMSEPPAPAGEPPVPASAADEPAPSTGQPATQPDISYVNVMQALVEEKADKYIKMFGLCDCPRCVTDVKALALNNLPPKYVVMPQGEVIPRISVYEGRYSAAVTMQILRACKTVMENPRHDRSN